MGCAQPPGKLAVGLHTEWRNVGGLQVFRRTSILITESRSDVRFARVSGDGHLRLTRQVRPDDNRDFPQLGSGNHRSSKTRKVRSSE